MPRLLRTLFRSRRALLGELCLAARDALTFWLRERTGCPGGRPGIVIAIQTFGDFLFWHPHLHILAAAGVFNPDGAFHLAPGGGWAQLRELWRHAVLSRLRACGALADWHVQRLLTWRNGGFTLDAGPAPVAATDAAGRRRIAEYLLRAPFCLEKISYNPTNACVLYRSERHWRTGRNFEVFRAHDFLAALIAQLPVKGVPMVRYYGRYANRRPRRPTPAATPASAPPSTLTPSARRRHRTRWRQLIYRIWGADPLRCPLCNGYLYRHSIVETPEAIRAMLEPLGLYEGPVAPAQAPPAPGPPPLPRSTWTDPPVRFTAESASQGAFPASPDPDLRQAAAEPIVVLDAESGTAHAVGACPASRIRSPLAPKTDPWYHRQWLVDEDLDYDAAGFELPHESGAGEAGAAQLTFFADDEAQSFPPDDDPATRSASWANIAQIQLSSSAFRPLNSSFCLRSSAEFSAEPIDDDFAQPFPPDELPTVVYD